jgi:hypothetical protein
MSVAFLFTVSPQHETAYGPERAPRPWRDQDPVQRGFGIGWLPGRYRSLRLSGFKPLSVSPLQRAGDATSGIDRTAVLSIVAILGDDSARRLSEADLPERVGLGLTGALAQVGVSFPAFVCPSAGHSSTNQVKQLFFVQSCGGFGPLQKTRGEVALVAVEA